MAGDLAHNERLKLTATYVNGVTVALLAVGGFAPAFNLVVNQTTPTSGVLALTAICHIISVTLHFISRRTLKGIRE